MCVCVINNKLLIKTKDFMFLQSGRRLLIIYIDVFFFKIFCAIFFLLLLKKIVI